MAVALDSNVVIGFLDRSDALHWAADAKVRELLAGGEALVCSVVTYAEILTGAKLGHHEEPEVLGFFRDLISELAPVDSEVAERAADLRSSARHLKMPDALIIATADRHPEVDRLVSGDEGAANVAGLDCEVVLLAS